MKKVEYTSVRDLEQQSLASRSPLRAKARPLSPHIQVYKWEWTMLYSILHRMTAVGVGVIGVVLSIGTIILSTHSPLAVFLRTLLGLSVVLLPFFAVSLLVAFYYIFATAKYMLWGELVGLDLVTARRLGNLSAFLTVTCTLGVLAWYLW